MQDIFVFVLEGNINSSMHKDDTKNILKINLIVLVVHRSKFVMIDLVKIVTKCVFFFW